jgi:alkanesulfonate monooxygenase SsuD/methylene tetrahydromethanopterin reductase-like flavin-dependent oxidoreductase (luciferase family)
MNGLGVAAGRETFEEYWRIWAEGRATGNPLFQREPRVGSTRHLVVADTDDAARAIGRRAWDVYGQHFFATDVRVMGRTMERKGSRHGADPDQQIDSGALVVGSPSTVRDRLLAYLDRVGPQHNYLVAAFQWGDMTHAEAMRSLQLYASEVMPALRR